MEIAAGWLDKQPYQQLFLPWKSQYFVFLTQEDKKLLKYYADDTRGEEKGKYMQYRN